METIKKISLNLNVTAVLSINTITDEVEVTDCVANLINVINDGTNPVRFTEHKINETENRYGILTLGAKSAVGKLLPTVTEITIEIDGKKFVSERPIVTHKSTRGRIDGLTQLFREYKEKLEVGAVLIVSYDYQDSILTLKSN